MLATNWTKDVQRHCDFNLEFLVLMEAGDWVLLFICTWCVVCYTVACVYYCCLSKEDTNGLPRNQHNVQPSPPTLAGVRWRVALFSRKPVWGPTSLCTTTERITATRERCCLRPLPTEQCVIGRRVCETDIESQGGTHKAHHQAPREFSQTPTTGGSPAS